VNLKRVTVRHLESIWRVGGVDPTAVEQESDRVWGLALSLAEGIHQLLQRRGPLDLEEYLVVVIGDLDVQVLARAGRSLGLLLAGAVVPV